jgi:hypothetical protein
MPHRIVLHAGFHKTGTTTVQHFFRVNRRALNRHMALRLRPQMIDLVHATRGYSTWRDPLTFDKVAARFDRLLDGLPDMPKRTLLISSEELSGHLPGRDDLENYSGAIDLHYLMVTRLRDRFPSSEIVLFFSTRDPDDWLQSAYWQHVKSSSLTLDFEAFAQRYSGAADLDAIVDDVAARVPCITRRMRLEACAALPFGPASPLLDICDIPGPVRATLTPPARMNTRPDLTVLLQLLTANRTYDDPEARRAAKNAILDKARQR